MNHGKEIIDQKMLLEAFADDFDDFDDFGDDIDLDELVEVADTVEQTHAAGQISFVPTDDDPPPPPILPSNTPCPFVFNPEELRTWVYPTNYPIRGYQLNIVHKAMFNNILVALPTGLGKTFIAAVVMYNYWRWFPESKIIFMAHTRPLVDQQIEACFTICGIPQDETAEMTGESKVARRQELWNTKRVFFATPQTVQNDLRSNVCPAHLVSCIVIDEAHKATGNYAFTDVIRKIYHKNKHFRVLALTATPGSSLDAVQSVITNLHISKIELRTEDSMDIRQFTHSKNIQRIVVKLGYTEGSTGILPRIINDFAKKVFEPLLLDLSKKPTTVSPILERATTFGLRSARLNFQATATNLNASFKYYIIQVFLVAESASRAYDYLCQFGIKPFIDYIESLFAEYQEKNKLSKPQTAFLKHSALNAILRHAKQEASRADFIGHPKLDHLLSILVDHFASLPEGEVSKVMIFSSFRSSVLDIRDVLDRHKPMIRSTIFVGQASDKQGSKGLNQKEQQEVIRKFKSDEYNVLVATSIGEEGLDIGEIDLIICYDSQSSPIRMLQRMGRTGRRRQGKCILLHTESEEKKFNQAKETYSRMQGMIAKGTFVQFYKPEPKILPANYKPTICRKQLTVGTYQPKINSRKRKKNAERIDYTPDGFLQPDIERSFIRNFCNQNHNYTNMNEIMIQFWPIKQTMDSINKFMPLQSRLQATHRVGHSGRTLQLANLVEKMEYRIMNPGKKVLVQIPKQQTQLKLPSKFSKNKLTLPIPRKRRNVSSRLDDEDFEEFMQNNNIDQIVDLPVEKDQQPPRKEKVNKGKSKMTLSQEIRDMNADTDMDLDTTEQETDIPSWDNEPQSWDPLLPDSVFDDVDPLPDLNNQKSLDSPSFSAALTPPPSFSRTPSFKKATTHFSHSPKLRNSVSISSQNDFSDDFDFSLDASFIEQADALVISKTEPGFDDPLEPRFDFEQTDDAPDQKKAITLVWNGNPPFSEKGLKLLEERQKRLEARTGHRILLYFQKKNTVIALSRQPVPLKKQHETKLVENTVNSDQSMEKQVDNDEFDDMDFNEDMFSNFLENKIDEDGYYAENFMYGQDETSTQNIAEKSILHVDNTTHNTKQDAFVISSAEEDAHTAKSSFNQNFRHQQQMHQQSKQSEQSEQSDINEEDIIVFDLDKIDEMSFSSEEEPNESENVRPVPHDHTHGTLQRRQSVYTIKESQEPMSQTNDNEENIDKNVDRSEESPLIHKSRRNVIISEDEQGSPSLLSALSKGLYTPSPLRQVRESESPILIRRRLKRPLIEDEDEEEDEEGAEEKQEEQVDPPQVIKSKGKRRLKRRITDEDDDDDFIVLPPSQSDLNRRLMQGRKNTKKQHINIYRHIQSQHDGGLVNPFIDHEADYTSEEGHTDEEVEVLFNSSATSVMNSFIDDEDHSSAGNSSLLSASDNAPPLLLHDQDDLPPNRKHWMNRFDADKWLNVNEEEDSVVVTDEEVEAGDEESVHDFTSDLRNNVIQDDGDDFI